MFNGSRFFHLLRKWKENGKYTYISILKVVMNHYFDSLTGICNNSRLVIPHGHWSSFTDVSYVLDAVGYHDYSIDRADSDVIVTLRNSL